MTERPNPDNDPALPDDPPPVSDPEPTPRFPKQATAGNKTQVTPLDEDKNLEDGIEVNET